MFSRVYNSELWVYNLELGFTILGLGFMVYGQGFAPRDWGKGQNGAVF
jgi:hypothetical protein